MTDARPAWPDTVPVRLRERVATALAGPGPHAPADLVQAAVSVTTPLLGTQDGGRGAALDLLAADALVTHALLRLAENPEDFDACCGDVMATLSSLVPPR
ncbi:MAG: hypothetical protein JNJ98_17525 [Gemmatimonadetes bacterium]|nr:hypothetical protein [Gemmatimonadota bacterium]